ncbi:MAG TPA: hypothetical protein VGO85_13345 [Caldimonas sp.]|nr:hypothetical protein [Caldimonas sp.]
MRKTEKPGAPMRRLWRMTPEAPRGEFVDVDDNAPKAPAPAPAPDELQESSWLRSSWDLLNGLEVTESGPGELREELFNERPRPAPASPARERPSSPGEWVRRFALRLAELDLQRDPRELIEMAKRRWTTQQDRAPEEAAELEHGKPAGR